MFATKLLKNIKKRFPKFGLTKSENAFANLLDPSIKGLHLKEFNMFNSVVDKLDQAAADLNFESSIPEAAAAAAEASQENLTPLEQLRLKFSTNSTTPASDSKVRAEINVLM